MHFAETATTLLAAHLISQFILQPAAVCELRTTKWWGVLAYLPIPLIASTALLGTVSLLMLAILIAAHCAVHLLRLIVLPRVVTDVDGPWPFIIEQLLYTTTIIGIAALWPTLFHDGSWKSWLPVAQVFDGTDCYLATLVLVSGLTLCGPAGGILIGKITSGMIDDVEDDSITENDEAEIGNILKGLPDGGRYIGWLERLLVLLFVLSGHPQGIGFLIATKSILRFGDIKNWHQRAATEYVIIGTFLSFAWAMLIAGLTRRALSVLLPELMI